MENNIYVVNLHDSFSNEGCDLFKSISLESARKFFRDYKVGLMTLLYLFEVLPSGQYKELDKKGSF